jgi:hypothetical protein
MNLTAEKLLNESMLWDLQQYQMEKDQKRVLYSTKAEYLRAEFKKELKLLGNLYDKIGEGQIESNEERGRMLACISDCKKRLIQIDKKLTKLI